MSASQLAAVLWDMDGTIVDSEPLWIATEQRMLARYGLHMDEAIAEQMVGSGLTAAAELFQDLGVPLATHEIIDEWATDVGRQLQTVTPEWRPGALELLASLREHNIPCALVTMAVRSIADAVVSSLPPGTFSAIVAGDEVTHEKPHPEPYLLGAAALGVDIADCIAVEDSPNGLRSAVASGAVSLGIQNMVDLADAPAHATAHTLSGATAATLRKLHGAQFGREARPRVPTERIIHD